MVRRNERKVAGYHNETVKCLRWWWPSQIFGKSFEREGRKEMEQFVPTERIFFNSCPAILCSFGVMWIRKWGTTTMPWRFFVENIFIQVSHKLRWHESTEYIYFPCMGLKYVCLLICTTGQHYFNRPRRSPKRGGPSEKSNVHTAGWTPTFKLSFVACVYRASLLGWKMLNAKKSILTHFSCMRKQIIYIMHFSFPDL